MYCLDPSLLPVQRSHGLFGVALSLGRPGGERRVHPGEVFRSQRHIQGTDVFLHPVFGYAPR